MVPPVSPFDDPLSILPPWFFHSVMPIVIGGFFILGTGWKVFRSVFKEDINPILRQLVKPGEENSRDQKPVWEQLEQIGDRLNTADGSRDTIQRQLNSITQNAGSQTDKIHEIERTLEVHGRTLDEIKRLLKKAENKSDQ